MEKIARKALHRGLKALLSDEAVDGRQDKTAITEPEGSLSDLSLSKITRNPFQPRIQFDAEEMEGLKESIRQHGVIEPIIVRRSKGAFEIVSGERRFRAVQELGYDSVPAIVRDKVSDREMKILALVENQQRSDLNDIEIASSYQELIETYDYTHEKLAQDTGKSRSFITNTLRLLKLPEGMREAIVQGKISAGHARALLALEDKAEQEKLFLRILQKGLSVRQAEEMVLDKKEPRKTRDISIKKSFDVEELENVLRRLLGTKVDVRLNKKRGKIIIAFKDVSELNRIVSLMKKE